MVQNEVPSLEDCWFYHVMDLPTLGTVKHFGSWDLRGRFDEYIGHVSLAGKTLVDVGSASGFLTFEAERRGAIVTSFDVPSGDTINVDPATSIAETREAVAKLLNSYRLAYHLLKSRASRVYGDARQLSDHVGPHDIVLVAQMLVHVRDPISVIDQACRVAQETVIVTEGSFEADVPIARFYGAELLGTHTWWHLSNCLYRDVFHMYGFELKQSGFSSYQCNHPSMQGMQQLWTFVAERRR